MRRQRRRGYTLIEVVLVMALMVILAALGYPSIESMYTSVKVDGAADSVRAAWANAQANATKQGRPYRFAVVPGKGNFRVAPDSSDFWNGGVAKPGDGEEPPFVTEGSLPKGMVFTTEGAAAPLGDEDTALPDNAVNSSQWASTAVFMPDGTAQDDVDIHLQLEGARPMVIHLRSLTGVVTVERGG